MYTSGLRVLSSIVGGPNFFPDLISTPCLFLMKSREIFVDFLRNLLVKLNLQGRVICFQKA